MQTKAIRAREASWTAPVLRRFLMHSLPCEKRQRTGALQTHHASRITHHAVSRITHHASLAALLTLLTLLTASPAPASTNESPAAKERRLILLLKTNAPPDQQALACKQLAVWGTKPAVAPLAKLLAD